MQRITHYQALQSDARDTHASWLCLCVALLLAPCSLLAIEPTRKELWVPSKHLAEVQKQHPGAVMLSPEEYHALIRDAGKTKSAVDATPNAPTSAVVTGMTFSGKVDPASDLVTLTGEVIVRSLMDDWAELDVRLPVEHLSSVAATSAQDRIALSAPDKGNIRKVIVRGRGEHKLLIEGIGYIANLGSSGRQGLTISTSTWPGALQLELPTGSEVVSKGLTTLRMGNVIHMPLRQNTNNGKVQLIWTIGSGIDRRLVAENNRNRASVHLAAQTITAQWAVWLEQLGSAPGERTITLDLNAPDIAVANVRGAQLARWQQRGAQLDLTVNADHGTNAEFYLTLTAPLMLNDIAQPVRIPALRNPSPKPSAFPAPPRETSPQLTRAFNADIASLDPDIALIEITQGQITERGLRWRADEDAPQLVVRRAKPRVLVDADALVKVTRDDIVIEHTLGIGTDRAVNELRVTLPDDEIFDTTSSVAGPPMEWKRVGQTLEYRWPQGLPAGAGCTVKLNTRQRFITGAPIKISPLAIPEAVKVSGYVALDYDTTWRVNITDTTGLEERDVTLTPVKGRMAWFNLRSFQLAFDVQRREPVFDVDAIGYALPRAHSVEIEGQFTLGITEAPLREVKIRFSKDSASRVRFISPNVAEQKLDESTGEWTVTLRQETMGAMNLRWALSIAAEARGQKSEVKGQQPDESQSGIRNQESEMLTTALPQLSLPAARRFTGQWIIEANTDTEITFDAKAMQTKDVRRVPIIEGYTPRHRLVASYAFATPEASLTLHAARHGHSELAALVVNELALRTVLATDGSTRHEATLIVQHSGEQFLNVQLPDQAILLSTLAAEHPVKPVRGPNGALSIPLPPGSANQPNVRVRLTYETKGTTWTSSGQRHLEPPTIHGNVPVLATTWEVFAPEGYEFGEVDTTMEQAGTRMSIAGWATALQRANIFGAVYNFATKQRLEHSYGESSYTAQNVTIHPIDEGDAIIIRPEFPKPMFVGTPVPIQPTKDAKKKELPDIAQREAPNRTAGVKKTLQKANSYLDLGDYDNATKEFQNVLRTDPYNVAARRGIERVDQFKSNNFDSARDGTRARMLNMVTDGWEDKVPAAAAVVDPNIGAAAKSDSGVVIAKMKTIRLPRVQFENASIEEAIEFLRVKSRDLDTAGDPTMRGLNLVLKPGFEPNTAMINLDLYDVPFEEALQYVTELAGMKYKIEPYAIVVSQLTDSNAEMFNRVFKVHTTLTSSQDAKVILVSKGVPFPDGAIATYNATTSELTVRNTAPNLDLVEQVLAQELATRSEAHPSVDLQGGKERIAFWTDDDASKSNVNAFDKAGIGYDSSYTFKSGLLSLALDLPTTGHRLSFRGLQAPQSLDLCYTSWERQLVWGLACMAVGAALFLAWGRRWPCLATLLAVLVLVWGVGLVNDAWQPQANAVLLGWFVALALHGVRSLITKLEALSMKRRTV